jgi:hypothetical protein
MTKQRREKTHINKNRDEKGDTIINTNEIQKIESTLKTHSSKLEKSRQNG